VNVLAGGRAACCAGVGRLLFLQSAVVVVRLAVRAGGLSGVYCRAAVTMCQGKPVPPADVEREASCELRSTSRAGLLGLVVGVGTGGAGVAAGADGQWIGRGDLGKYSDVLARTAQLQGRPGVAAEALARWRALRPDGPEPTGRSRSDGVGTVSE